MGRKPKEYPTKVIFQTANLFCRGLKAPEIARRINDEFGMVVNRQRVYSLLADALDLNYIRLVPPPAPEISDRLARTFTIDPLRVHVVTTPNPASNDLVPAVAAEKALERIKELHAAGKCPTGIGLGTGRATLDFCKHLSAMLRADPQRSRIKLTLHATCAGGPALLSNYSPTSMFNLFPAQNVVASVGLFTETMCRVREFRDFPRDKPAYADAAAFKDQIDILVNSMGTMEDEHDLLRRYFVQEKLDPVEWAAERYVVGNFQYRPFTATGPLQERSDELRAVTLFDLDDFARLAARPDKLVILIVRQCGLCRQEFGTLGEKPLFNQSDGRNANPKGLRLPRAFDPVEVRARAFIPLLRSPNLRVFSDLIVDETIASAVLEISSKAPSE